MSRRFWFIEKCEPLALMISSCGSLVDIHRRPNYSVHVFVSDIKYMIRNGIAIYCICFICTKLSTETIWDNKHVVILIWLNTSLKINGNLRILRDAVCSVWISATMKTHRDPREVSGRRGERGGRRMLTQYCRITKASTKYPIHMQIIVDFYCRKPCKQLSIPNYNRRKLMYCLPKYVQSENLAVFYLKNYSRLNVCWLKGRRITISKSTGQVTVIFLFSRRLGISLPPN